MIATNIHMGQALTCLVDRNIIKRAGKTIQDKKANVIKIAYEQRLLKGIIET